MSVVSRPQASIKGWGGRRLTFQANQASKFPTLFSFFSVGSWGITKHFGDWHCGKQWVLLSLDTQCSSLGEHWGPRKKGSSLFNFPLSQSLGTYWHLSRSCLRITFSCSFFYHVWYSQANSAHQSLRNGYPILILITQPTGIKDEYLVMAMMYKLMG